jgi:hypothetical protein
MSKSHNFRLSAEGRRTAPLNGKVKKKKEKRVKRLLMPLLHAPTYLFSAGLQRQWKEKILHMHACRPPPPMPSYEDDGDAHLV